ncbi:hypothetical protein CPE2_0651 [Chlamydia pecorum W73]|uniref:DUF2764 family protein n=1 Tax=Chlamydia pecorum TaxID=85991 RepID=UPI0003AD9E6A|nr:DUF2764 family protein [Chlamydia pecorum]AGW39056.1 hypothetical protein CPE2_0651 [Chlamydia pecorum W73]
MTQYYFLSSFLPSQQPEASPVFSIDILDDLFDLNLSSKDLHYYTVLKRFFDFENFAFFWADKPLPFSFGTVTQENVASLVRYQQWTEDYEFEEFFKDFLLAYRTPKERLKEFSSLVREFLTYYQNSSSQFLREYFTFKQQLRVVLAGFRAKVLHLDVSYLLRNEDSSDPVVLQVLMQKDAPNYELPQEFSDLKDLLADYGRLPHTLHRTLLLYEFHKLEEFYRNAYFDENLILAKAASYMFAIRNHLANAKKGREIINQIEKAITW